MLLWASCLFRARIMFHRASGRGCCKADIVQPFHGPSQRCRKVELRRWPEGRSTRLVPVEAITRVNVSLRPRLVTKSIERVSKCGGGLIALIGRHKLGLSFQSQVRQFGPDSMTAADQIFLQIDHAIGGDRIG